MRNLMFIFCFLGLFSCKKENNENDNPLSGLWISEYNDTLNVSEAKLITYTNYESLEKHLFDYKIKNDSLFLFPMQSSNMSDWKGYSYELTGDNLLIRDFFNHNETNFIKK